MGCQQAVPTETVDSRRGAGRVDAPAEAEALSGWVGSRVVLGASLTALVRDGGCALFYYIRVVYLVAWDSDNLIRGTAEKPGD